MANQPTNIVVCDDDNDGFFTFNLTTQDVQILGGQTAANFSISYHVSQLDADINENALSANSYINTIVNTQTIYARVEK